MGLQLILGRAGSGKSRMMLQRVATEIQADPFGDPIIIIVPEQMSFQTEYQLLTEYHIAGTFRAQVYSFTRLAWRIFQETGGLSRQLVSPVAIQMLLRKIVEEHRGELRAFQRAAGQAGFYEQLARMLTEFKRYLYPPEQVGRWVEQFQPSHSGEGMLEDKLHDLHLLYHHLEEILAPHYVEQEDYLPLLASQMADSSLLRRATIWLDGFYSFTPQELLVIERLLETSKEVRLTLPLDPALLEADLDVTHLFYHTQRTYYQMMELVKATGCELEAPQLLQRDPQWVHPSLAHLEEQFEQRPPLPFHGETAVTIATATNRRAEVEGVARQLIILARDHGYRWREMALFVRKLDPYEALIQEVFQSYQIPVFLDAKRSIMHHPLIELLRSALDVIVHHWSYEAVFRCIKTDLFYQQEEGISLAMWREEMDRLENLALAYGIQGSRWYDEAFWERLLASLPTEEQERIDYRRQQVVRPLRQWEQHMKASHTLREQVEAFYQFLLQLGVPTTLTEWSREAEQRGALEASREHIQAWQIVMDLFDQLVEVLGEEYLNPSLLQAVLETGLESHHFALVPPALDQVLVGVMDRSRLSGVRIAFILGVNDGVLPATPGEEGMLDEWERSWLQEQGLELAPTGREQLLQEDFLLYTACSRARDALWFSYALADEEGRALTPSLVLQPIKKLLPEHQTVYWSSEPADLVGEEEQAQYLVRPHKALRYLVVQLRQWLRGYPIYDFWWETYNWLLQANRWRQPLLQLLGSLFYRNQEGRLHPQLAEALYGKEITTSVSRMEQFQSCPFAHFANYGLQLAERKRYRLTAPDMGLLFHRALQWIDTSLKKSGHTWAELNPIQCERLARAAVEHLAPQIQQEILFSSPRHLYLKRKLEQVIGKTTESMSKQARQSRFEPLQFEVEFSKRGPLRPLQISLPHGGTMWVEGRIDRVDLAQGSQGTYLRVIDYKSSFHELDLAQVYYGLQLQMFTYLDVLLQNAPRWLGQEVLPAGVLYFHMHNPMLRAPGNQPLDYVEKELYKQFRMSGLLLEEEESITMMDQELAPQSSSDIIPVARNKNGSFSAYSSLASNEQFQQIQQHVRTVMQSIGSRLAEGEVEIAPYQYKDRTACTYCPYGGVCQFDQSILDNQYRLLPTIDKKELFMLFAKEGGVPFE